MARNLRKELIALFRSLGDGWNYRQSRRNSHWRITGPDGQVIYTSASPSCSRALNNIRADLRRAGATVPPQH